MHQITHIHVHFQNPVFRALVYCEATLATLSKSALSKDMHFGPHLARRACFQCPLLLMVKRVSTPLQRFIKMFLCLGSASIVKTPLLHKLTRPSILPRVRDPHPQWSL